MGPIVCYAECLGTEAPGLHVPAYRLPVSPEMLQKCENSYMDRKCYRVLQTPCAFQQEYEAK